MNPNIASNIRTLEIIKVEILHNVTNLYGDLISEPSEDSQTVISNDAANIITLTYILCRRLGISFDDVNKKIKLKLERSIKEDQNLEKNLVTFLTS